jgi:hypothetical protein
MGNHEVLNLIGDLRYIEGNGYSDFTEFELAGDRKTALSRFQAEVKKSGVSASQAREAFEETHPPGYFGRLRAFDREGKYGSWLLSKPAVIMINGYVFLHGGLTDQVAALGLEGINEQISSSVTDYLKDRALISGSNLLSYRQTQDLAAQLSTNKSVQRKTPEKAAAGMALLAHFDDLPFSPGGPLWYRGNSVENERVEWQSLTRALKSLDADAIVVGHTPTGTGRITSRFNGKLYRADVGMAYGRPALCLVIEGGQIATFSPAAMDYSVVPAELPGGERYSDIDEQLPDKQLERFLQKADVVKSSLIQNIIRGEARHAEIVDLESRELDLRAIFQDVDEPASADGSASRRYIHEIAAYKLDRMLDLNLVPVAVVRKVEGKTGSLQMWIHSAVDLNEVREYGREDLLELLAPQIKQGLLFITLMGEKRDDIAEAGRMLLPKERRVMVMDNTKAFPIRFDVDELIAEIQERFGDCELSEHLEMGMRSLQRESLKKTLGDYLSEAQIDAMLARRDRILELCGD